MRTDSTVDSLEKGLGFAASSSTRALQNSIGKLEKNEVSRGVSEGMANKSAVSGGSAEGSVSHEVSGDCIDVESVKSRAFALNPTIGIEKEFAFNVSTSLNRAVSSERKLESTEKTAGKGLPSALCERPMIEGTRLKECMIGP